MGPIVGKKKLFRRWERHHRDWKLDGWTSSKSTRTTLKTILEEFGSPLDFWDTPLSFLSVGCPLGLEASSNRNFAMILIAKWISFVFFSLVLTGQNLTVSSILSFWSKNESKKDRTVKDDSFDLKKSNSLMQGQNHENFGFKDMQGIPENSDFTWGILYKSFLT